MWEGRGRGGEGRFGGVTRRVLARGALGARVVTGGYLGDGLREI